MSESRLLSSETRAILLCAGRGERLRPITDRVPKVLVPVRDRPLIDYHLGSLHDAGVRSVVLVVHHLESLVRDHVGDGRRFDLAVEYVHQDRVVGTGEALRAVASRKLSDPVLVGYGDVYFGPRQNVWAELLTSSAPKMVAARVDDAGNYGRLDVTESGATRTLRSVVEKDRRSSPGLVNAGAYLLPQAILSSLQRLAPSPRGEIELTDAIQGYVADGGTVEVLLADPWIDVGTPEALARAEAVG